MKYIFAIILLFTLTQVACKKKSDPLDSPSVQQNNRLDTLVSMSALINGQAWQTDSVFGYTVFYPSDSAKTNLYITATNKVKDTPTSMAFFITNYIGARTYIIDPSLVTVTYYVGSQRHFATSGQITVTSDSNYAIIGTFNFQADTISVTQGVFNVAKP